MSRKIEEIDPERFIYQNYEPDYWTRLGMCFSCGCLDVAKKAKACALGWCDASRLSVRPRPGCIAVMCEDEDGEPFWFHMEGSGKEAFLFDSDYDILNSRRLEDIDEEKFRRFKKVLDRKEFSSPEREALYFAAAAELDTDEVFTILRNYDSLEKKYGGKHGKRRRT